MTGAAAGTKILFAGGYWGGQPNGTVDIYDTVMHTWSTAYLTNPYRQGMVVVTLGNKIFFTGGNDDDTGELTSRIDIYDALTNTWSTEELSERKSYMAAVGFGNKVYFAGGYTRLGNSPVVTDVIDIYDIQSSSWTTKHLSEARAGLTATVSNEKIYFAGGSTSYFNLSGTIDIYDPLSDNWSLSQMDIKRGGHAAIADNSNIFWAGGGESNMDANAISQKAEIRDVHTGVSTFGCNFLKAYPQIVKTGPYLVFYSSALYADYDYSGIYFDIYNTVTHMWYTGRLNKKVAGAAFVAMNNTIYVAGGRDNGRGPDFDDVWILEF